MRKSPHLADNTPARKRFYTRGYPPATTILPVSKDASLSRRKHIASYKLREPSGNPVIVKRERACDKEEKDQLEVV